MGEARTTELGFDPSKVVKVVSFDLDDTLWPTMKVIDAANDALAALLAERFPRVAELDEDVPARMKAIIKSGRVSASDLTTTRKLAVQEALVDAGYEQASCAAHAEDAFATWADARHEACGRFLFDGAVSALRELQAQGLVLCAITNGNSNVSAIPELDGIFSVAVTSERVGESKPAAAPFETAIRECGFDPISVTASWVHVGDSFSQDCAGAKALKLRTVWIKPEAATDARAPAPTPAPAAAVSASPGQEVYNAAGARVFESMGSEDYLATQVVGDIVDATVPSVTAVPAVIAQWQRDTDAWLADAATRQANDELRPPPPPPEQGATEREPWMDELDAMRAESAERAAVMKMLADEDAPASAEAQGSAAAKGDATKFCMECGTEILRVAKFCPECGTRQPA